jgi:hypothetical protein
LKPGEFRCFNYEISKLQNLLHFFVRRVLAATPAELFHLQPIRLGLPVLGSGIVPLFAITALHRNNFSGHENSS